MACADCGAAGPTSGDEQAALEGWAELVEFVEALVAWNEAQPPAERQCGHPCPDYMATGECACTVLTRRLTAEALKLEFGDLASHDRAEAHV